MVFFTPYRRISEYVNCPSTPCRRQRREELELLFLLNLGTNGGEWSALRPGHALPPGKDSRFPLDRRLGVSQSWSGHTGSKSLLLTNHDHLSSSFHIRNYLTYAVGTPSLTTQE
jgi:hypothetical protein